MGEQRARGKRSRNKSDILIENARCIYCAAIATTVEHMPPRAMFRARDRPSGLEFPSCVDCNTGTRAADAAAAFFCRIDKFDNVEGRWKLKEGLKHVRTVSQLIPGFHKELFDDGFIRRSHMPVNSGILLPIVELNCRGPIATALLAVFGAKLGMALYHEHIGQPLPLNGCVHAMWFLNNSIDQATIENIARNMPGLETLRQGKGKSSAGQFDYRYNTDDKTVVAALTHFHDNLHFFTITMADATTFKYDQDPALGRIVRPGELVGLMPKPKPFIFLNV